MRLPGTDGRIDPWNRSALEAAKIAEDHWVSVRSNRSLGAYELFNATGELSAPVWPEMSFSEILNIAFRDRFIDSYDHPVLRGLRGEA